MAFNIVPMNAKHVQQVVDVHVRVFPEFFLSFLGPRFLGVFYSSLLEDPHGIGFVAEESETENVLGIISGTLSPQGFFKRLLIHKWWAFCLASIGAVLRRPTIIRPLFAALFFRGEPPEAQQQRSLLCSIGVAPEAQGRKIGQALTKVWLKEIQRRGSTGAYLKTDAEDNDAVNRFYQKSGWVLDSTFQTPQGRIMNR